MDSNPMPAFGTDVRTSTVNRHDICSAPYSDDPNRSASWAVRGDTFAPVPKTTQCLPAGFYRCIETSQGAMFESMSINVDTLVDLPDEATDMLLSEFITFWKHTARFTDRGLSVKRGLLLWGPPGSGKTSAIQKMANHMIQVMDGIVVMADCHPELVIRLLHSLREVEPSRSLIVVFEDVDALVEQYGESALLALLDGEHQIANVVNVATTNYPERLDRRFADRPGRFDRVQFVGMPTEEARRTYFKARLPEIEDDRLERWVAKSDGWSIAHLRELVIATEVLGDGDADTIERVAGMQDKPTSAKEPGGKGIGFAA